MASQLPPQPQSNVNNFKTALKQLFQSHKITVGNKRKSLLNNRIMNLINAIPSNIGCSNTAVQTLSSDPYVMRTLNNLQMVAQAVGGDLNTTQYVSYEQQTINVLSNLTGVDIKGYYNPLLQASVDSGNIQTRGVSIRQVVDNAGNITGYKKDTKFNPLSLNQKLYKNTIKTSKNNSANDTLRRVSKGFKGSAAHAAVTEAMNNASKRAYGSGNPVNFFQSNTRAGNPAAAIVATEELVNRIGQFPVSRNSFKQNNAAVSQMYGDAETLIKQGLAKSTLKSDQLKYNKLYSQLNTNRDAFNKGAKLSSFEQQERTNERRTRETNFLTQLFKGLRGILGKNPLYDLLRWGLLWLGKTHPILAAIGLTLVPLAGNIGRIWNVLRGIGTGGLALAGFVPSLFGKGKGGLARNAAAVALRSTRNMGGPLGVAARWGANVFTSGVRTGGAVRGVLGGVGKFAARGITGPLAGLVNFGINKMNGQSTGEAASRAVGSTLGWAGGAALGGLLTPILGPLGPILGGAIGSTLGDMLGGWMFPMFSKIGSGIADMGKTIGNMWTSFKEQHSILARLLTIVNPVLGIFDFFKTLLDHLPWTKDRNKGDVQTGTAYKSGQVYGDPIVTNNTVAVLTPEERKKREEKYKKDLEYYNSVAKDDYLNKSSYSVTFGKWMTGRENMLERNKIKYAENQLSKGMWAPNSLARAQERARLIASPEAQAYAEKTLNAYLVGEGDRLKRERDFLDSSIGVDSKYGSIPSSFKTEKINGVNAVNLHQLGIGGVIKGDSYANNFIGAGRVNRMKELDSVFAKYGVGYKITSTMGDAHEGGAKSHYAGNKVDIVPTGNLDARTKSQLERELRQRGFYNGNTGAVGWHNAGSGYHWDLSLLTSNELKTMGKTLSSTQKAVATATATQEETATSVATASNGLRQSVFDRVYGKDSSLAKAREIIFTATDVTGSLGVWGITQVNNTGRMRT